MRAICTHTSDIATEALRAFCRYAPDIEFVETKGLYGYNEAIASRWDGSSDLVVIEQDKEITTEVIPSFEKCSEAWCVYSYKVFPDPFTKRVVLGLGCTRYSAEVQKVIGTEEFIRPDYDFWSVCRNCNGAGCWVYLDARIAFSLMKKGYEPHIHGEIRHHHSYPDARDWPDYLNERFVKDGRVPGMSVCPSCGNRLKTGGNKLRCGKCPFVFTFYV